MERNYYYELAKKLKTGSTEELANFIERLDNGQFLADEVPDSGRLDCIVRTPEETNQ